MRTTSYILQQALVWQLLQVHDAQHVPVAHASEGWALAIVTAQ